MSDDTTNPEGWGPAQPSSATTEGSTTGPTQADPQRVGFCQDCGKPLTAETLRAVGTGVFCEPCLVNRVGPTASTAGYTTVPPYTGVPPAPVPTGEPHPVLAAILGLIPGVGAMYNGQFAKGIAHLAIFAILVSLSDNVNGIFGVFVAGWVFYMSFEAYHTAIARRDGLPLPNAFGFNDIGERLGFGKSWGNVTPRSSPGATTPPPPVSPTQPPPPTYGSTTQVPVGTAPEWVGYVPPTSFGGQAGSPEATAAAMTAQIRAQAAKDAGYAYPPYAETYTAPSQAYDPTLPAAPLPTGRRFPSGAIWLIALGVLILVANLLPDWKLTAQWWPPILLAGLSVWLFTRRLGSGIKLICIIRWPVILMVLAVLLALHAAYLPITIGLTGSILLITFGALLLLERTAGAGSASSNAYVDPYNGAPVVEPNSEATTRAAWTAPGNPDDVKGGHS